MPNLPERSPDLYALRMAGDPRPGYRLLASLLAARIADGTYPLQSKLPGKQKLAEEFGVAAPTVERALRVLAEDGLVQPVKRAGTYVVNTEPNRPLTALERLAAAEAEIASLRADVERLKRRRPGPRAPERDSGE